MRLLDEQQRRPARRQQIKLTPERSVVKLHVGDPIRLTEAEFERLCAAFFAELERRFL
jgi:hypothetical protein